MAFDATASGGNRYFVYPVGTVTPGQKLLITARMQVVDIAGGYYNAAQGAGPTATVALRLHDQAFVSRANFGASSRGSPTSSRASTPSPPESRDSTS